MQRRPDETAKTFAVSPCSGERSTSGAQSASCKPPTDGCPSSATPSTEASLGKLPVKWLVSTTTARTTPGAPSRTIAWSTPGSRRRRVSQPSYTWPLAPKVRGAKTAGPG